MLSCGPKIHFESLLSGDPGLRDNVFFGSQHRWSLDPPRLNRGRVELPVVPHRRHDHPAAVVGTDFVQR